MFLKLIVVIVSQFCKYTKNHFEMVWNIHFLIFFFNVYVSRLNSVIQNFIDNAHYKKTCWLKSYFFFSSTYEKVNNVAEKIGKTYEQYTERKYKNSPKFVKRASALLIMSKWKKMQIKTAWRHHFHFSRWGTSSIWGDLEKHCSHPEPRGRQTRRTPRRVRGLILFVNFTRPRRGPGILSNMILGVSGRLLLD